MVYAQQGNAVCSLEPDGLDDVFFDCLQQYILVLYINKINTSSAQTLSYVIVIGQKHTTHCCYQVHTGTR